ncbi:MAG: hypothetical protein M1553_00610 [Firmicutes bacterium]|nr:hypothetical protein [Bacillota bacterium]
MTEPASEEVKVQVLEYLGKVSKAKNADIARSINVKKAEVDRAVNELAREGKVELLYIGTSYVKLAGKED